MHHTYTSMYKLDFTTAIVASLFGEKATTEKMTAERSCVFFEQNDCL